VKDRDALRPLPEVTDGQHSGLVLFVLLYEITTLCAKLLHGVLAQKLNESLQAENAERMRAERSAREAERELQVTIDTIPAIVARHRRDGSPDFVNQTWRTYIGLSDRTMRRLSAR
jgi:PAS domain-containing protein